MPLAAKRALPSSCLSHDSDLTLTEPLEIYPQNLSPRSACLNRLQAQIMPLIPSFFSNLISQILSFWNPVGQMCKTAADYEKKVGQRALKILGTA